MQDDPRYPKAPALYIGCLCVSSGDINSIELLQMTNCQATVQDGMLRLI